MSAPKKKRASEMTDDEVMLRLFPRPAVEKLKGIAHAQDRKAEKNDSPQEVE